MMRVINEKFGVFDIMFLTKLVQNCCVNAVVVVVNSLRCKNSFDSGLTAAYSQNCCPLIRITVSSTC